MRKIIHIGGNKTASTLLQRRLFAAHPGIRYLGEDCRDYGTLRSLLDTLVGDDDSFYEEAATRMMFDKRFSHRGTEVACVYSNEDIMTSPLPSACAARLKRLMPDADVVMVIRNQLTVWPSWYANHGAFLKQVPRRYWRRPVDLAEWLDYCFAFPRKTPVEAMNYERFYRIFEPLYGRDRMHVLLYEELLSDPRSYYGRWAGLLGLSTDDVFDQVSGHRERPRISARRMRWNRFLYNWSSGPELEALQAKMLRALPALRHWLDAGPSAEISLPRDWTARVVAYYRDSNSRLATLTGLDLGRAGYPVS